MLAGVAVLAVFHHLWFLPVVFLAGQVGVEGCELEEASHVGDVADVVSSVLCESAASG